MQSANLKDPIRWSRKLLIRWKSWEGENDDVYEYRNRWADRPMRHDGSDVHRWLHIRVQNQSPRGSEGVCDLLGSRRSNIRGGVGGVAMSTTKQPEAAALPSTLEDLGERK